ncbi:MAG: hypothetical protein IPM29_31115 [Planctomycetes bacterium]|nr:hypothetical protein [Planctomycetota bacterium]
MGRARLPAIRPGRYDVLVEPDDVAVEPAEVLVGGEVAGQQLRVVVRAREHGR